MLLPTPHTAFLPRSPSNPTILQGPIQISEYDPSHLPSEITTHQPTAFKASVQSGSSGSLSAYLCVRACVVLEISRGNAQKNAKVAVVQSVLSRQAPTFSLPPPFPPTSFFPSHPSLSPLLSPPIRRTRAVRGPLPPTHQGGRQRRRPHRPGGVSRVGLRAKAVRGGGLSRPLFDHVHPLFESLATGGGLCRSLLELGFTAKQHHWARRVQSCLTPARELQRQWARGQTGNRRSGRQRQQD
jgi:hypothetical protein